MEPVGTMVSMVALFEYGCSNFCSQWVCCEYGLLPTTTIATGYGLHVQLIP
jgi:hypothetical protein